MEFGGSWSSFFMYLQYSTVAQICCTCAVVNKNIRRKTGTRRDTHHGHKECQGTYHGHLKAAHWGAKKKRLLLRSNIVSHGHLNLWANIQAERSNLGSAQKYLGSAQKYSLWIYIFFLSRMSWLHRWERVAARAFWPEFNSRHIYVCFFFPRMTLVTTKSLVYDAAICSKQVSGRAESLDMCHYQWLQTLWHFRSPPRKAKLSSRAWSCCCPRQLAIVRSVLHSEMRALFFAQA